MATESYYNSLNTSLSRATAPYQPLAKLLRNIIEFFDIIVAPHLHELDKVYANWDDDVEDSEVSKHFYDE